MRRLRPSSHLRERLAEQREAPSRKAAGASAPASSLHDPADPQSRSPFTHHAKRFGGVLVAAATAGVVLVLLVIPQLTGSAALTVLSGSMTPTYPVGSVLIVRPVSPDAVAVDDVITYVTPGGGSFTTHRVTGVRSTSEGLEFTTKGDANQAEDSAPVTEADLRGRVWFHVKYLGQLREALSSPTGLAAIVGLVSLTLVWDRANSFVRRRRRPTPLRVPAHGPTTSQSAEDEGTARIADARPGAPVAAFDPADETTAMPDDAEILDSVRLPSVTVDLHPTARVEQQLMLARLNAGAFARGKVTELLDLVRGHVVSIGALHMIVTITGTPEHLDGVEQLLRPYGLVEASRSAVVHTGGEPAPKTHVPQPPEPVGAPDTNLTSLVLRPPPPPGLTLTGPSSNGHPDERSDQ